MVIQDSRLVTLVSLVDRIPMPPTPAKCTRDRPPVYSDRLFLKALVIMIVRHLCTVYALLSVLAQPAPDIFGALAEFERELIRERTMAGLAAARARAGRASSTRAR